MLHASAPSFARRYARFVSAGVALLLGGGLLAASGCGGGGTEGTGGSATTGVTTGTGGAGSTTSSTTSTSSGGQLCGPGTVQCGEACVDTKNDPKNCGSCDMACPGGQVCVGGVCSLSCGGGTTKCGDTCADTGKDAENCGGCGVVCPPGQACFGGGCVLSCAGGTTKCGEVCADTKNDPKNCGACGTTCSGGKVCSMGACALSCAGGTTKCGDLCVSTDNDPLHCGSCGSECATQCAGIGTGCGQCFDGMCICNSGGTLKCNGVCIDVQNDSNNCNGCGHTCGPNGTCLDFNCVCPAGTADCGGGCVDLVSNQAHCGACGNSCSPAETCTNAECVQGPGTVNQIASPASGNLGTTKLTLASAAGFAAGQQILIHQTQGAGAGAWEIADVVAVAGNDLTLGAALLHKFTTTVGTNLHAQAVIVEKYATLDVAAGNVLAAPAWNGQTGGILALNVTGAMTVAGVVSMAGRGYRGTAHSCAAMGGVRYTCVNGFAGESSLAPGVMSLLNNGIGGAGGAKGQDCGMGAGGSYATAGQVGVNNASGNCTESPKPADSLAGTLVGNANLNVSMFFGGAGGEGGADEDGSHPGKGGNGGGIVYIKAGSLAVTGTIITSGAPGGNGNSSACGGGGCGMAGGGAGAGGAIRIIAPTVNLTGGTVTSLGGTGGTCTCGGNAGNGGNGRIAIQGMLVGVTTPAPFSG